MIRKNSMLIIMALLACSCSKDYSLCLVFDNVEGLKDDSKVLLNGVEIGEINDMKAFANGVYVDVSINADYKIPKNSAFSLIQPGFMEQKFIDGKSSLLKSNTLRIQIPLQPIQDMRLRLQNLTNNSYASF